MKTERESENRGVLILKLLMVDEEEEEEGQEDVVSIELEEGSGRKCLSRVRLSPPPDSAMDGSS